MERIANAQLFVCVRAGFGVCVCGVLFSFTLLLSLRFFLFVSRTDTGTRTHTQEKPRGGGKPRYFCGVEEKGVPAAAAQGIG